MPASSSHKQRAIRCREGMKNFKTCDMGFVLQAGEPLRVLQKLKQLPGWRVRRSIPQIILLGHGWEIMNPYLKPISLPGNKTLYND